MIKLFKNFKLKDVIFILISIALIVFQVHLELKMPDYMASITKLVQTKGSDFNEILTQGFYMMSCAFGSLISAVFTAYFISSAAANFSFNVRKKIFDKVESLSIAEVKKFSTSSLITRTTNDITQVQMFIAMGLQLLIKSPITAIWAISKILNKSLEWSILTGVAVLILLTTVSILILIVVPKFKVIQKLTDKINEVTRENLTGIRVVRAFNAEKFQEHKFDMENTKLTNIHIFTQKGFAVMQPIMYLVLYFLTLSIYFIGAKLIDGALMSDKLDIFSNMVVFSSYAMQVIMSFLLLAFVIVMMPRAQVSASRIREVLDTKESIKGKDKSPKTKEVGTIEFNNVSFKYSDAKDYLLEDVSLKIDCGQTVAIIGSTGSGKSTLINLIPRFYDATKGSVKVDGIDVKEYKLEDLYNKIGYVSQKPIIFNGSVKTNIKYGKAKNKITDEKMHKVASVAQASNFINKLDNKFDSFIAASGTNVSGGQKQRISIARAIARDPEIYIFDDSFSALDYKTDANLRKELKKYTKDATMIIVAQRIGTIINADKIVVLDDGKVVGIGTHKELLKKCSVYKQIAKSQLSKEELENA